MTVTVVPHTWTHFPGPFIFEAERKNGNNQNGATAGISANERGHYYTVHTTICFNSDCPTYNNILSSIKLWITKRHYFASASEVY